MPRPGLTVPATEEMRGATSTSATTPSGVGIGVVAVHKSPAAVHPAEALRQQPQQLGSATQEADEDESKTAEGAEPDEGLRGSDLVSHTGMHEQSPRN